MFTEQSTETSIWQLEGNSKASQLSSSVIIENRAETLELCISLRSNALIIQRKLLCKTYQVKYRNNEVKP